MTEAVADPEADPEVAELADLVMDLQGLSQEVVERLRLERAEPLTCPVHEHRPHLLSGDPAVVECAVCALVHVRSWCLAHVRWRPSRTCPLCHLQALRSLRRHVVRS